MTATLGRHAVDVTQPIAVAAETRRRTGGVRRTDVLGLTGAAVAALCLAGLLFAYLAPLSGLLGFVVTAWVAFVGVYAILVSCDESGPAVRDRVASVIMHSLAFVMLLALVVVVGYTIYRGHSALMHVNFFTQDLGNAGPLQPLDVGGIRHAVLGTLIQISIALTVSVPLGLTSAVFLSETRGPFTRFVRTVVEAMTALPSIVAGLFIYSTLILIVHVDKSGFAAACALSVMMLPIIIRAADVVIRLVPATLREAALATGASQWRTVLHVVLPTARSGLTTAVILGTARGIGETSPVLLTAGYTTLTNVDPLSGPMVSLPLATLNLTRSSSSYMIARGFGAAATLMIVVLVLFVVARLIGGRAPGQLSRRAERRLARRSARDRIRFEQSTEHWSTS